MDFSLMMTYIEMRRRRSRRLFIATPTETEILFCLLFVLDMSCSPTETQSCRERI